MRARVTVGDAAIAHFMAAATVVIAQTALTAETCAAVTATTAMGIAAAVNAATVSGTAAKLVAWNQHILEITGLCTVHPKDQSRWNRPTTTGIPLHKHTTPVTPMIGHSVLSSAAFRLMEGISIPSTVESDLPVVMHPVVLGCTEIHPVTPATLP